MDSGFCVLKGLIDIYKIGVYGSALVNKSEYWPSVTYVDQINSHFLLK